MNLGLPQPSGVTWWVEESLSVPPQSLQESFRAVTARDDSPPVGGLVRGGAAARPAAARSGEPAAGDTGLAGDVPGFTSQRSRAARGSAHALSVRRLRRRRRRHGSEHAALHELRAPSALHGQDTASPGARGMRSESQQGPVETTPPPAAAGAGSRRPMMGLGSRSALSEQGEIAPRHVVGDSRSDKRSQATPSQYALQVSETAFERLRAVPLETTVTATYRHGAPTQRQPEDAAFGARLGRNGCRHETPPGSQGPVRCGACVRAEARLRRAKWARARAGNGRRSESSPQSLRADGRSPTAAVASTW